MKRWYTAETGNHQGLIVDEQTGKNIAVAYDKADAPLLAAAPELLEALTVLIERIDRWSHDNPGDAGMYHAMTAEARQALQKAKGL